jgi:hypothetical protein
LTSEKETFVELYKVKTEKNTKLKYYFTSVDGRETDYRAIVRGVGSDVIRTGLGNVLHNISRNAPSYVLDDVNKRVPGYVLHDVSRGAPGYVLYDVNRGATTYAHADILADAAKKVDTFLRGTWWWKRI